VCVNVVVHHNTCIKKENMPTMLFESPQTSYDMQKWALSRKGPISCQIERFGFFVLVSFFFGWLDACTHLLTMFPPLHSKWWIKVKPTGHHFLEGKSIGLDQKKQELKAKLMIWRNNMQARVQGMVQLKGSICF